MIVVCMCVHRIPTDGLLKMLYMVLLHQQLRHPGAPKTQAAALQPTPLPVLLLPLSHFLTLYLLPFTYPILMKVYPLFLAYHHILYLMPILYAGKRNGGRHPKCNSSSTDSRIIQLRRLVQYTAYKPLLSIDSVHAYT